ncbi:hypothetical protein D3C72_976700 [compost metagenome]
MLGPRRIDIAPVPVEQRQGHGQAHGQGRGVLGLITGDAQRSANIGSGLGPFALDTTRRRLGFSLGHPHRQRSGGVWRRRRCPVQHPRQHPRLHRRHRRRQHGLGGQSGEGHVALGPRILHRRPRHGRLGFGLDAAQQGFAPLLHQHQGGAGVGHGQGQGVLGQSETALGRLGLGIGQGQTRDRVDARLFAAQGADPDLGAGHIDAGAATPAQFQVLGEVEADLGLAPSGIGLAAQNAVSAQGQLWIGADAGLAEARLGGLQQGVGLDLGRGVPPDPLQQNFIGRRGVGPDGADVPDRASGQGAADDRKRPPAFQGRHGSHPE